VRRGGVNQVERRAGTTRAGDLGPHNRQSRHGKIGMNGLTLAIKHSRTDRVVTKVVTKSEVVMFGTTTSAFVRLVIKVGAAAIGILLLFAGLVRSAELDSKRPAGAGGPTNVIHAVSRLGLDKDGAENVCAGDQRPRFLPLAGSFDAACLRSKTSRRCDG
jgi:hypothetical protein